MLNLNCKNCSKPFVAKPSDVKRGYAKFCSRSCSGSSKKEKLPNVTCAYCSMDFYKPQSKLKSKNNIYFCSRQHKDIAQRIGGISAIHPPHYGKKTPKFDYRSLAFRELPNECKYCGYNRYLPVLDVHHKDGNHSNNELSNLEIACPTCHTEQHYLTKTGRFTNSK